MADPRAFMSFADKAARPFVVLTAPNGGFSERALHSVLEPSGYAVVGADSGLQLLELAHSIQPDAVLIDTSLADIPALEVCRQLSGDPGFSATTPIILLSEHGASQRDRHEAYVSGVWELCSQPLDSTALLLKLQIYMRARRASEWLRERSLVDDRTGLYNMEGLRWRAGELGADAARRREPLACIVFRPMLADRVDGGELDAGTVQYVATACRSHARGSDVLGRIAANEFAFIAPATDAAGATRIIERVQEVLAAPPGAYAVPHPIVAIRASHRAVSNFAESAVGPVDMLLDAKSELENSMNGTESTA